MLEQVEEEDSFVLGKISGMDLPFLEGAMSSLTGLGSFYIASFFLLVSWVAGLQDFTLRTTIGILGMWTVTYSLKYIVRRERPADSNRATVGYSFPSGHSATAFYLAVMFSSVLNLAPLLYTVAGLVATSRIYFRLHYPLDALAGSLIGVSGGYLTLLLL
ncbi:MAG: phosphatase PAP2 family protein [Candidatus Nanohaloarchaea archaeon]